MAAARSIRTAAAETSKEISHTSYDVYWIENKSEKQVIIGVRNRPDKIHSGHTEAAFNGSKGFTLTSPAN